VLSQGVATASAMTSVSVGLQILTSLPQLGTLGPTYFLVVHMHQLLRSMVLVGNHSNHYITDFLCVRISPFDFILLPDNLLPGVERNQNDKEGD